MLSLTDKDLVRILRTFADDPDDVLVERQTIVCKINGEDISVEWSADDDGILYCKEPNGKPIKARFWIEKRLARLDELASRIQQHIAEDKHFIPVPSHYESIFQKKEESSTTEALYNLINEKNPCATEAIYLLSEAGEGKTMIMENLANMVAENYKDKSKNIHFLFLPVSLQGRPFLRIDDLVIGILANKYRFREYYFEAIIELVKLGMIVLGLDGFEEMVVEGKEDNVISSLGELLSQMNSNGKIVISARRAFYDYALTNQEPLVESIRGLQVDFSSYRLSPWTRNEFCSLLKSYAFSKEERENIYQALAQRLKSDHPILTRPVLARKLVEMFADNKSKWKDIVNQFDADNNPQAVLEKFVTLLLRREATQKWLSSNAKQLLKTEQHFELLQNLAEEMWFSNVEYVKQDFLQTWTEIFCEQQKMSPADTKDCKEKIIHHAMLYKEGDHYLFCHEAFRQYFLGRQIASYIKANKFDFHFRKMLSQDILENPTIDSISFALSDSNTPFDVFAQKLCELKGGESKISPISQNIAGILVSCWKRGNHNQHFTFENLYFAESTLAGSFLKGLTFDDCFIEKIDASIENSIKDVSFVNCSISVFVISTYSKPTIDCTFDSVSIPSHLFISEQELDIYDPDQRKTMLVSSGAKIQNSSKLVQPTQPDEELTVFCKIVRRFYRTSGVTGSVLALVFGDKWSTYEQNYMPQYLSHGLLQHTSWKGQGNDERYKLGISISNYEYALKNCNGSFSQFLSLCQKGS